MAKIVDLRGKYIESETEENSEEFLRFARLQKERRKEKKKKPKKSESKPKKIAPKKREKIKTDLSLEWNAPEFFYFEKTEIWFVVSGLIAIALFLWALWTRNIFFALIIILGYFIITAYAIKKPRKIAAKITAEGIKIDRALYPYDNLKSFWIFYEPPTLKEISVLSRKKIMPHIKIPLGEQDPVAARKALIQYLPEKRQEESLTDNLSRQIKF
ncbi:hypothetical protein KKG85_00415 [Patescibacteria group bacterium]|nr:hypothetical protein [Patescibacteria group bacterium]MBU2579545.1 hypothetical protein [Patescibacteria group bacterium]